MAEAEAEPGLGEVLALMTGAHRSFRTLRGELRSWHHTQRHHEAFTRQFRGTHASEIAISLSGEGAAAPPVETEDRVQLWLARPDRLREELTCSQGDQQVLEATLVQVGETWWAYNPGAGAQTNDGDPNSHQMPRLQRPMIDPSELLPWRALEIVGRAVHAGRPAIHVASRPSPRDAFLPDVRGISGDWPEEYLVDAERGILLRLATFLDGEPFAIHEFLSVTFDEHIADDVFVFVPPPGEEVRNAREMRDELRVVPLHEVAQAAPFAVFIPVPVPADWRMRVHFVAENQGHGWPASVSIHYADQTARVNVNVNEHDAGDASLPVTAPNGDEWRVEQLAIGELRLWEPSDMERGMPRIGVIDLGGTRIQISSGDLDLDAIAELAATLVPAPTEPPAAS